MFDAPKNPFVGRRDELDQFTQILQDPRSRAVIITGPAAFGKTWLANRMGQIAQNHPDLSCGQVRYEVTPTDSVETTLSVMMDDAFEAANNPGKFWGTDDRGKKQWLALFKVGKIVFGDRWDGAIELAQVLKREPTQDTRRQFLDKMNLISKKMPPNGRALFIIDPEKYMQDKSDQAWRLVVKDLPVKIILLFPQRPDDALITSENFGSLDNVVRIPETPLDVLDDQDVEELINLRQAEVKLPLNELRTTLARYRRHPHALQAALDLLKDGVPVAELPPDPTPEKISASQWKRVKQRGENAIALFKALAVLEVSVDNDTLQTISQLAPDSLDHLLAVDYLWALLRPEAEGRRIYHALLADHILSCMTQPEITDYHSRAITLFRRRLADAQQNQTRPDPLAAQRLPEHVLAAEGESDFVTCFINECSESLYNLGLFDSYIGLSERALSMSKENLEEQAMLWGNLGLVYRTRGDLKRAEEMHKKALEINEQIGRPEGMANQYGNLGSVYKQRGNKDTARKYWQKAQDLYQKIGLPHMVQKTQRLLDELDS